MSTNLQDYIELLNSEQHVDVTKLRELARHGISYKVRGEVWLYLLDVLTEDKTSEISSIFTLSSHYQTLPSSLPSSASTLILKTALEHHTHRFFNPTYSSLISSITAEVPSGPSSDKAASASASSRSAVALAQNAAAPSVKASPAIASDGRVPSPTTNLDDPSLTLRSQYSRFLPPPPNAPPTRQAYLSVVEEVLGKYWNTEKGKGRDDEYRRWQSGMTGSEKVWVWLVTPFVCCLTRPGAIFLGFEKLMERMRSFPPIPSRIASVLTLFRIAIPELFAYFEDEQVPYPQIALSWVQTLLAKEMWLGNVLRLWDAYLAAEDMFELHCYVCVAVLATCKETLEELDGSEAKLMLLDLPPMDVDRLLQDAANLKISFALPRPVEDLA